MNGFDIIVLGQFEASQQRLQLVGVGKLRQAFLDQPLGFLGFTHFDQCKDQSGISDKILGFCLNVLAVGGNGRDMCLVGLFIGGIITGGHQEVVGQGIVGAGSQDLGEL